MTYLMAPVSTQHVGNSSGKLNIILRYVVVRSQDENSRVEREQNERGGRVEGGREGGREREREKEAGRERNRDRQR
jgi:hypothetical protein